MSIYYICYTYSHIYKIHDQNGNPLSEDILVRPYKNKVCCPGSVSLWLRSKTLTKTTLGEEGFISSHNSQVPAHHWGMTGGTQAGPWRPKLKQRRWRDDADWLLSLISYCAQDRLPRSGTDRSSSISIHNHQENAPQRCQPDGGMLQLRFSLARRLWFVPSWQKTSTLCCPPALLCPWRWAHRTLTSSAFSSSHWLEGQHALLVSVTLRNSVFL